MKTAIHVRTQKAGADAAILQLKIVLLDTKPSIWRRVLVPAALTLAELHVVIQATMNWQGGHLHSFRVGDREFGVPSDEDFDLGVTMTDEAKTRISEVLTQAGSMGIYDYDFGDDWEHAVTVEKVLSTEPGVQYPLCTGGKLAGPPEDCGGVSGYYYMLEALDDPDHDEHDMMEDWIGSFDPKAFSVEAANRALRKAFRPVRRAHWSRSRDSGSKPSGKGRPAAG
ncbi:MAG: plasmid pRiA4b ORF-3 family protein [Terriglobales bacterium]